MLFNKGLARLYLSPPNPNDPTEHPGIIDMRAASAEKQTDEHAVIDDAIRDRGDGYTVFSIVRLLCTTLTANLICCLQPVGVLYRPSEKKLKNSTTKDYMGKAVRLFRSASLGRGSHGSPIETGCCQRSGGCLYHIYWCNTTQARHIPFGSVY